MLHLKSSLVHLSLSTLGLGFTKLGLGLKFVILSFRNKLLLVCCIKAMLLIQNMWGTVPGIQVNTVSLGGKITISGSKPLNYTHLQSNGTADKNLI